MTDGDLRREQAPLKETYRDEPDAARVTLTASSAEHGDARACSVDIGRAIYEAELHEGVGGPGAGACSGDLLRALAACAQLTAQAVAASFGLDADVSVDVEGDLDLRGTLGVDEDAPVGFEAIRLAVTVDGEVDIETRRALERVTERSCVVYRTLLDPPAIETSWPVGG